MSPMEKKGGAQREEWKNKEKKLNKVLVINYHWD